MNYWVYFANSRSLVEHANLLDSILDQSQLLQNCKQLGALKRCRSERSDRETPAASPIKAKN